MPEVYENGNIKVGQWRRFLGTGKWVIIPTSRRQKKPAAFLVREKQDFDETKKRKENCPFCTDNLNEGLVRDKNPEELKGALVEDDSGRTKWVNDSDPKLLLKSVKDKKWKTCIIKNINPVLDRMTAKADFQDKKDHPYTSAEGLGICDIIVESQAHFKPLGVLGKEVCKNVISTYLYRFNDLLDKCHSLKNISIFHNHRREAGATISHSHSQIFATPFTPIYIKNEESQAEKYFVDIAPERSKKCPFCAMIAKETESFVFSIDAKFENDLKKSKLSKELKDEFKTKGFPLSKSENATVTKKNDDEWEWVIIDGEKIYIVKSEERKLNFYIYQDSGRVIRENASFIAIAPFASGSPFEIWILPKKHTPSFGNVSKRNPTVNDARFDGISEDEIGELADILTWTLGRLYICVDDPGYNFVISTPPLHFRPDEHRYWHWHIRIETQGLVIPAGYEMASQVRINPLPPENAAIFLKNMGNLFKPEVGNIFQRKPEDVENVLSIIKREVDEKTLNLRVEQQNILKIAAGAFKFSEYYIKRKDLYDKNELTEEEKTILNRAMSWASQ